MACPAPSRETGWMLDVTRQVTRLAGAILFLFQAGAASAVELSEAVRTWFGTDRSSASIRTATTGVARSTAMAVVTYLPDPTGNATETTAAIFRAVGTGWQHVQILTGIRNPLVGKVTFDRRSATFEVAVPLRGDANRVRMVAAKPDHASCGKD